MLFCKNLKGEEIVMALIKIVDGKNFDVLEVLL